jgi:hypothetical protein
MSDLTTRRVILLVLAMIISLPAFTISTYKKNNSSYEFGLELIATYDRNDPIERIEFENAFNAYVEENK